MYVSDPLSILVWILVILLIVFVVLAIVRRL